MAEGSNINVESRIYEKGEIDFSQIIKSIKSGSSIDDAGAILTFTGIVRNSSHEGKSVESIKIDAYDELANKSIQKICTELKEHQGIIDLKIIHLKGEFQLNEDLVYVVVASAHREEGFEVLRNAVERYKKEIAVWKKEIFIDGKTEWVH